MKLNMVLKEFQTLYKKLSRGDNNRAIVSCGDKEAFMRNLAENIILLYGIKKVLFQGDERYAPPVKGRVFRSLLPNELYWPTADESPIRWKDLCSVTKIMKEIQQLFGTSLDELAELYERFLHEDLSKGYLKFPAYTLKELRDKYRGRRIDINKLNTHYPDSNQYLQMECETFEVAIDYGILSFCMYWNNEDDYPEESFTVYGAFVQVCLDRNNTIRSIRPIKCYNITNCTSLLNDRTISFNDIFASSHSRPVDNEKLSCERLDALLARTIEPVITDEIVWRYSIEEMPTGIKIGSRNEDEKNITYYCFRTDFDFRCSQVEHCCAECPMLRWVYKELLPQVVDGDSFARLQEIVEEAKLFPANTEAYTCQQGCDKVNCNKVVQTAVDEIRRYYNKVDNVRRHHWENQPNKSFVDRVQSC